MAPEDTALAAADPVSLVSAGDVAAIEAEARRLGRGSPTLRAVALSAGLALFCFLVVGVVASLGLLTGLLGDVAGLSWIVIGPVWLYRGFQQDSAERLGEVIGQLTRQTTIEEARATRESLQAMPRWTGLSAPIRPLMLLCYGDILSQMGEWAAAERTYDLFLQQRVKWKGARYATLVGKAQASWASCVALQGQRFEPFALPDLSALPEDTRHGIRHADVMSRAVLALRHGSEEDAQKLLEQELRHESPGEFVSQRMATRLLLAFTRARRGGSFRTPAPLDEDLARWIAQGRFDHLGTHWPELRGYLDSLRAAG